MPFDRDVFGCYFKTLDRLAPGAEWCAAGIRPHQLTVNEWCISCGRHCCTGLEDSIPIYKTTLAPSNAALVARTVNLGAAYDRPAATHAEARAMLGLHSV